MNLTKDQQYNVQLGINYLASFIGAELPGVSRDEIIDEMCLALFSDQVKEAMKSVVIRRINTIPFEPEEGEQCQSQS